MKGVKKGPLNEHPRAVTGVSDTYATHSSGFMKTYAASIHPIVDASRGCIVRNNSSDDPSRTEYGSLADAFDYFNAGLFEGVLPPVLITLNHRAANSFGYYHKKRFSRRHLSPVAAPELPEISLNPKAMAGCSDMEVLSTLVHEMVHLWQDVFGTPSRGGYHNREWAQKMEGIGLMPSNTGAPGGRRTGQQMADYILTGGLFERACRKLLDRGWKLNWHVLSERKKLGDTGIVNVGRIDVSKTKFTCPGCAQNAWAKPAAYLVCGCCGMAMQAAK